jgi:hypothetical protein
VAALGAALNVSFDVIVQLPGAGCRRMFLALLVVVTRSPVSGVIVTDPLPTVRFAGLGRTTVHFGSSVLPLNSSLDAAWAKYTL